MDTNARLVRGDYVDLFTEASLLEPGCSDPTKAIRRARADFFDRVLTTKTFELPFVDGERVQKRLTLEMLKRPDLFCGECGEKGNAYSVVESNTKTITVWCGVCKKAQTNLVSLFPLPTASALRDLGLDLHVREVPNKTEGGEPKKTFEFWSVVDGKRVQKRLTLEMFKRLDLMCGECGKGAGVHVVSGDKASVETTWCGHCQKVVTHMRSLFPLPAAKALRWLGLDDHAYEVGDRKIEGENK